MINNYTAPYHYQYEMLWAVNFYEWFYTIYLNKKFKLILMWTIGIFISRLDIINIIINGTTFNISFLVWEYWKK